MNSSRRAMQGFTLIEILVAMLVVAVGILGVAAMQMVSFQTNQSAYARSQAVYLAQDMFDRMRANPEGYLNTTVYDDVDSSASGELPAKPNCVATNGGCTPVQMAQQDVLEWASNFGNVFSVTGYQPSLPNGRGLLVRVGATNDFTATVSWDETNWDDEDRVVQTRQLSITARMN